MGWTFYSDMELFIIIEILSIAGLRVCLPLLLPLEAACQLYANEMNN